ncbi:MAG: alpha/beta hydrolase [Alphaproteobacteria bacterium]
MPKVFLDYTQEELDRAYDQRAWAPNAQEVIAGYRTESDATLARLGPPLTFAYGPSPVETLDVFRSPSAGARAPIHMFVHGGAWRLLSKRDSYFPANAFAGRGVHFIAVDFALIDKVDLAEMVRQVRAAVAWTYRNAEQFGGDPERIFVSGHSSGGHLTGCVLTTDWRQFGVPETVLKGGMCASGMFDLHPVRLSARSSYVKLDDAMEQALSAQRNLDFVHCPITVVYGDMETPEFQRHGRDFAAALKARGLPHELVVGEGLNHFELAATFGRQDGVLARAARRLMRLE